MFNTYRRFQSKTLKMFPLTKIIKPELRKTILNQLQVIIKWLKHKTQTHFINGSSSCIDLIFYSNTSYLTTGMEQSIYGKCHYNIIYMKLNFDIPLPPPYYSKTRDYKKANIKDIRTAISIFNWVLAFQNKDINEKTKILTETLMNIFGNFIPNRISKFDHEKPVWTNSKIILYLNKRSKLARKYHSIPTGCNKILLVITATECSRLIIEAKEKQITRLVAQLEDPSTAPKTYRSILNRFLHNKKIPNTPIPIVKFFQISRKKLRSLIHISLLSAPWLWTIANYLL